MPIRYVVVLVVPLMMLADYYLTLWGARLSRNSGYGKAIGTGGYELNPVLQQDVARQRRFSPRHLAGVLAMSVILLSLAWLSDDTSGLDAVFNGILGYVFAVNLILLGRHASNILLFHYLLRNAGQLTGEVQMSRELVLRLSQYETLPVLFPLVAVALASWSPFAIGSVLGACGLIALHQVWRIRETASRRKAAERHRAEKDALV